MLNRKTRVCDFIGKSIRGEGSGYFAVQMREGEYKREELSFVCQAELINVFKVSSSAFTGESVETPFQLCIGHCSHWRRSKIMGIQHSAVTLQILIMVNSVPPRNSPEEW